jgi:hypothetical protein
MPLHKQKYRVEEDFEWELECIPLVLSKALFGKSHKMFTFEHVKHAGKVFKLKIPKDAVFCLDQVHTKGSLKFKGDLRIEEGEEETIAYITEHT